MTKINFKSIADMEQYGKDVAMIRDDVLRKLSDYLRGQRCRLGVSVQQVSENTGLSVGAIEHAERGTKHMHWAAIARLLRYYGCWVELKFVPLPEDMK